MYGRPLPAQAGRLHVVELALPEHRRAHRARHDRREDDADHDDQGGLRAPEPDQRDDGDHDQRQREHGVHDPADRLVDEAAEEPGDQADHRPRDDAEDGRERCDAERVRRPGEHAREHVAAELVGPEPVCGARRLEDLVRYVPAVSSAFGP